MNTIIFTVITSAFLWLLLSTIATPRSDSDWPAIHEWLKEVCRIVFAASMVVLLLLVAKAV